MMLLHVLISVLVSSVSASVLDEQVFRQFLDVYYSDPHPSMRNDTNVTIPSLNDDAVLINVKPAPLPKPPVDPPIPPVVDITILEKQLFAPDGFAYQKFGQQIAIAGSVVAVSTNPTRAMSNVYLYEEHVINGTFQGFQSTGAVSSQTTKQDGFGSSIALSEDVLVVGAPQDNTGGFSSGKVYVFESQGLHIPLQTLSAGPATPPKKGSLFGQSLSLFDNTLAVGAPGYSSEMGKGAGAVFLYEKSESTSISFQESFLIFPPTAVQPPFGQFGSSVQLQQNFLAVSAVSDSTALLNGGAVHLYTFTTPAVTSDDATTSVNGTTDGTTTTTTTTTSAFITLRRAVTAAKAAGDEASGGEWTHTQTLQPADLPSYAYFGRTIAFRGSLGLIAAYNEEGSGVVYVYWRGTEGWVLNTVLLSTDPTDSYNNFGSSLMLYHTISDKDSTTSATTTTDVTSAATTQPVIAVVGSSGDSTNNEMAGAIYVFGVKDASNRVSFLLLDKLTNSDSSAFDEYGTSLAATDEGHLLVGAVLADSLVSLTSGVVYVESNLVPYYVEAVGRVEESPTSDDVSAGGGSPSLSQLVRDALLSTVGIVLLATIPAITLVTILGVVALRGGFSKHRYQSAAQAVDAHGNLLDSTGNIIEPSGAASEGKPIGNYAYFVNPLKKSKVVNLHHKSRSNSSGGSSGGSGGGSGSMDMQSVSSDDTSNPMLTKSTDLDTLYARVNIHGTIRSPQNSDHTIYPSPIIIPPRAGARDVIVPTEEDNVV